MKVAVVCPYDLTLPGGVQEVARRLVDGLATLGHEAWLVGPGDEVKWGGLGSATSISANRSRVPIALRRGTSVRTRAALAGCDVVHVHEPLMPLTGPAALRSGHPVVATFHADAPSWTRFAYHRLRRPLAGWFRDAVVTAVSPVAASAVPQAWGLPRLIPNGVEPPPGGRRDARLVLFLGRDEPRKGLDVLLRAWPDVVSAVPDARLVVAGSRREPGTDSIEFLGFVDEDSKRELLGRASILVTPNLGGESFGMVGVEGQAAGCAVVASDLPGFRHALGDAALFVPAGNASSLARTVRELLLAPAMARDLSNRGVEHARRYEWGGVVTSYVTAYQDALGVG